MNPISRMNAFDSAWYTRLTLITIQVEVDKTVAYVCLWTSVAYALYFDAGP